MLRKLSIILGLVFCLVNCQKSNVNLSESTSLKADVKKFEAELAKAKSNDINLFAPENFASAEQAGEEANNMLSQQKDPASISLVLQKGRAELEKARAFDLKSRKVLREAIQARQDAIRQGADELGADFFQVDEELSDLSIAIEKGKQTDPAKATRQIARQYDKLGRQAPAEYGPGGGADLGD